MCAAALCSRTVPPPLVVYAAPLLLLLLRLKSPERLLSRPPLPLRCRYALPPFPPPPPAEWDWWFCWGRAPVAPYRRTISMSTIRRIVARSSAALVSMPSQVLTSEPDSHGPDAAAAAASLALVFGGLVLVVLLVGSR